MAGIAAVANYAPKPVCPPGSVPYDARGTWECRTLKADTAGNFQIDAPVAPLSSGPRRLAAPSTAHPYDALGNRVAVSGPTIYPPQEASMPRAILTGSLAPPLRSSAFNTPTFGDPGYRPGVAPLGLSTTARVPSIPTTTYNPTPGTFGPVIDAGCDNLPAWAQGICRATGQVLTGAGSPGGSTQVVPGTDPTPYSTTPAERSMGQEGAFAPMLVQRSRLECPPARNGSRQVLYFSPLTGDQVCLPAKGGAAFARAMGLLRKWAPRPKPYISAQDVKLLKKADRMTKKAKAFAKLTGQTCHARGRGR